MGFVLMLRFEKFSQRSQGQLPVACEVTAMAAHEDEGLPDFEGFFDEEWMDEQIEVGNCVFVIFAVACALLQSLRLAMLFSFASRSLFSCQAMSKTK